MTKFKADYSYYKFIDPQLVQMTNIFFMDSEIILNDNLFDIFDIHEYSVSIFESNKRIDYYERANSSLRVEDREYFGIFFRADNEHHIY